MSEFFFGNFVDNLSVVRIFYRACQLAVNIIFGNLVLLELAYEFANPQFTPSSYSSLHNLILHPLAYVHQLRLRLSARFF